MQRILLPSIVAFVLTFPSHAVPLFAQQVNIGTPFNTVSDEYFERVGVDFGFTLPNSGVYRGDRSRGIFGLTPTGQINPNGIQFRQGSAAATRPTIGGYDPSGDAQIGFGYRNSNGGGFNLNFFGSKGSSRTLSSTTPSVTTFNGVPGSIFSGTLRPFVTSFQPVVGGYATPTQYISPVNISLQRMRQQGVDFHAEQQRLIDEGRQSARDRRSTKQGSPIPSSAATGALSIAEIKQQKSVAKQRQSVELLALLNKVDIAESEERFGSARVYLNQAIRKTAGEQRQLLEDRYEVLKKRR